MMEIEIPDRSSFGDILRRSGDKLIVVRFYASWSGPCKRITPEIQALSEECPDNVFCKVNVDEASDVAEAEGVSAMPTFQFFKSDSKVGEVVGADLDAVKNKIVALKG